MTSNIESFEEFRNYRNSSSYNGTNYNHNTKLASSVEKILDSNEEESKSTEKKKQRRASLHHIEELSSCRISASEGVGVEAQIMVKKGDEELYISSCRMSAQRE